MIWIFWGIWILLVALFVVILLYVSSCYLLIYYDRRLSLFRQVDPPCEAVGQIPTAGQKWKGFWLEVLATYFAILVYPMGWFHWRAKRSRGAGHPILLVHGFYHNKSAWLLMRSRLARAGFGPIYTLNLTPKKGSIDQFAALVDKRLGRWKLDEVTLVGHSMGGLVCAYYAEHLAPAGRVRQVITLGSPLQGTRLAIFAGTPAANQMSCGSQFIQDLEQQLRVNSIIPYFHLATQSDSMITPPQAALLKRYPERERVLSWQGHMTLLYSKVVTRQIVDWLRPRQRVSYLEKSHALAPGK